MNILKQIRISFLITVLIFLYTPVKLTAQNTLHSQVVSIDFSGVDSFWAIKNLLQQDHEPDEKKWNALFNTPYYRFYKDWGQTNYIKNNLKYAYMPSMKAKRDSIQRQNDWRSAIINHLLEVGSLQENIKRFEDSLKNIDLIMPSLKLTQEFLPANFLGDFSDQPKIAFGISQPDGNAGQIICMDIKKAMDIDLTLFIAHEAHHYYTIKLRKKFTVDDADSSSQLIRCVQQLQLEGIADMIDKPDMIKKNGKGYHAFLFTTYLQHFTNPEENLKQVDSLIIEISKNPFSTKANAIKINDLLPQGGHPHGYYMATTIMEAFGKKKILELLANPFDFIRWYNRASEKLKRKFKFSQTSLNYFSKLEATHAIP